MTAIILIQMPFFTVRTPSLSLSLLQSSLREADIECDIEHLNIDFAEQIGDALYRAVSENVPQQLLTGDLLFAGELHGRGVSVEEFRRLAGQLEKISGGELRVVPDSLYEAFDDLVAATTCFLDRVVERIDWSKYQLAGFGTIFNLAPSLALARRIKQRRALPHVVLGGSSCEGVMGATIHRMFPWVDYVARGEGEDLIVALARHLRGDDISVESISGLVWRSNNKTICNGPRAKVIVDLDKTPFPDYSDWLTRLRSTVFGKDQALRLPIETSRGCWFGQKSHCTFCGLNGETLAFRRKSPERALAEFRMLFQSEIKAINAVDNILDHRYFDDLLPSLAAENHDSSIFYEIKSNLSYQQLKVLKAAGIHWIQPGIESLNSRLLKIMRKGVTAFQNIRLLKWAAELKIGVVWNILYGFPDESHEDYIAMAKMMPLLAHLPPPLFECNKIRLDRFSPLFDQVRSGSSGAAVYQDVRPAEAYRIVYRRSLEDLEDLAYYFDYISLGLQSYVPQLRSSVRQWHEAVQTAVFACLDRPDGLHLFDSRSVAQEAHAVLTGLDREVMLHTLHGATLRQVETVVDWPSHRIQKALDRFKENGWSMEIDQRYLSLPVPVTDIVPMNLDDVILEPVVHELYLAFSRRQREFVDRDLNGIHDNETAAMAT